MLSPGSKGWINKYFDLIENGTIKGYRKRHKGISEKHFLHLIFGRTGIVFGQPTRYIFANSIDDSKWTASEKLKLLLFESHLFVYQQKLNVQQVDKVAFTESLLGFYAKHGSRNILNIFSYFMKESQDEKLESIFSKRVDIKLNLLENKWWVSSLGNVFVYLDVLLYHNYLHGEDMESLDNYSEYAYNALTAMTLAAYSDGVIEEKEKAIFNVFLASANLPDEYRNKVLTHFKTGVNYGDFTSIVYSNWLFKRFVLELCILTIFSGQETESLEIEFLVRLATKLDIPENEFEESMAMIENFVLVNHEKIPFLSSSTSYERVYSSLSSRWGKVILRNKDKLSSELKESKQLVGLIKKSATVELTKEEKELVKSQFMDIVKSMPALAIFMLPGGAILLPVILKLLPDLVPSAFKDNEVEN